MAEAQSKARGKITEVGLSLNMLHYSGDLAESRIVFKEGEFGFGFHVRRALNDHVSLVGQGVLGRISGDDANNGPGLKERRFRFFSPIKEFGLFAEVYPFAKPFLLGSTGSSWRPFAFVGGAVVLIDPRAEYYGLGPSPFPEEGLSKTLYSIPVGLGLRADVYDKVSVFGSVGWRPTFSDKLDGVAKNGNPDNPDWYTNIQVGFSFMLSGYETTGFE